MSGGVEAIDLARELMLRHGWDLAICITDAPLSIGRRPVVDASATRSEPASARAAATSPGPRRA